MSEEGRVEWGGILRCITSDGIRNMAEVLNEIEVTKKSSEFGKSYKCQMFGYDGSVSKSIEIYDEIAISVEDAVLNVVSKLLSQSIGTELGIMMVSSEGGLSSFHYREGQLTLLIVQESGKEDF